MRGGYLEGHRMDTRRRDTTNDGYGDVSLCDPGKGGNGSG